MPPSAISYQLAKKNEAGDRDGAAGKAHHDPARRPMRRSPIAIPHRCRRPVSDDEARGIGNGVAVFRQFRAMRITVKIANAPTMIGDRKTRL